MDYACLDLERKERTGFPEVIFCQGKDPSKIASLFKEIYENEGLVLGTRASEENYKEVKKVLKEAKFHKEASIITVGEPESKIGKVAICSAGSTDIPVSEEAAVTAEMCGANVERFYDVGISGIHRLLNRIEEIKKANVIVAAAGMEGALPSVIAGLVSVPVIALPTSVGYGTSFNGVTALLAMLNSCAPGITVVNIDNGFGAGYSAAKINSLAEKGRNN